MKIASPDQEMADIQLHDLRDRGHRADRVEGQAMAGMDFEAEAVGKRRRFGEPAQFGGVQGGLMPSSAASQ